MAARDAGRWAGAEGSGTAAAPRRSGRPSTGCWACKRAPGALLPRVARSLCPQTAPDESEDIIGAAQCILDREYYFEREVDRYLKHIDFLKLRKKEILYKKWLESVLEPVLQKLMEKMDSVSSAEIEKRNQEQLSLYLNHCNKKGFSAFEDYDPSEYDPYFLKTHTDCWKVSIPILEDPLLRDLEKKFIEMGIIYQCETGRPCSTRELKELTELPLLPLSRQRMDALEWLKIAPCFIVSEAHRTKKMEFNHHKDGESP